MKYANCSISSKDFQSINFLKVNIKCFYEHYNTEKQRVCTFDIDEQNLTRIMIQEPHKELKEYFQKVGSNIFGWNDDNIPKNLYGETI